MEHEAANILTFYFRPQKPLRYTAGQYIQLTLPHDKIDEHGDKRWFTLSSSPTDKLVSITSKFTDKDGSSFKHALYKLKPGSKLTMSEPLGNFILPERKQTPLVFVAGGIGITPFHSMMSWLSAIGETRPIKLLYGVTNEAEIIFHSTIEHAPHPPKIIVSNPSPTWSGERGYLTAKHILTAHPPSDDTMIYISGPEAMAKSLIASLMLTDVKRGQLVLDFFPGYPSI